MLRPCLIVHAKCAESLITPGRAMPEYTEGSLKTDILRAAFRMDSQITFLIIRSLIRLKYVTEGTTAKNCLFRPRMV
jgi:hypothetical protein